MQLLSVHLQFEHAIEHRPKSDKGSFTTDLPVHSREDLTTSAYMIVSLIVIAIFQLYNIIFSKKLMKTLIKHDILPTLFAFAPLILFLGDLKSSRGLGISPELMDRL
jgi:amino acid permease